MMRAHGKAWNEFARWCQARGLASLPAHPWTLAAFVRWCEPRHDYPAIVAATKAIARRHLIAGHADPERHPMVKRTLAMIERRIASNHQRSALFEHDAGEKSDRKAEPRLTGRVAKRPVKSMRSIPKLVSRRR